MSSQKDTLTVSLDVLRGAELLGCIGGCGICGWYGESAAAVGHNRAFTVNFFPEISRIFAFDSESSSLNKNAG